MIKFLDLPHLGKIQYILAIFFIGVGCLVIVCAAYLEFKSGTLFSTSPDLPTAILNHLSSNYFTSGLGSFGIGLALVTIAYSYND
jgi:hypothetical protein